MKVHVYEKLWIWAALAIIVVFVRSVLFGAGVPVVLRTEWSA